MPSHKSCKKRMKTSQAERMRNRGFRSRMSRVIKELRACTNRADADRKLKNAISIIDKAAQRNIIHKNKAANDKSKLTIFTSRLSE
ncbi:MAG: 30S ribosomal protein S20 [Candidatus Zixiibacteriota bacterium]|nr:MAG: 30S ribosomal protein S20 [candidate division Zixibacteria bacterium]HHI03234.1 30S ribosomal protein S20 [candidate division Zixibacteria bacterium]